MALTAAAAADQADANDVLAGGMDVGQGLMFAARAPPVAAVAFRKSRRDLVIPISWKVRADGRGACLFAHSPPRRRDCLSFSQENAPARRARPDNL